MTETAQAPALLTAKNSVLIRMAMRFGVDAAKFHDTLKATAFRGVELSNEQLLSILIVADQYQLNPLTREIFAFVDTKTGAVNPVVSVDGWSRIVNEHPQFNGEEFKAGPDGDDGLPAWIEATIWRRDREHPTRLAEWMRECRRNTPPWNTHPRRMLRHKARIQCARYAFGFAGIYDPDEAERIASGERDVTPASPPPPAAANVPALKAINADVVAPAQNLEDSPPPVVPNLTFAQVAEQINAGTPADNVEVQRVADPAHRKELRRMLERRDAPQPPAAA